MKKRIAVVALGWMLLLSVAGVPVSEAITPPTAIYLVPHADDEALTFSVPIRNDLRAGKRVIAILFSQGEKSVARNIVNGEMVCPVHGYVHNPVEEGYLHGDLSVEEFGELRVKEYREATAALGVTQIQTLKMENENFHESAVRSVIQNYARLFPNAEFKTMSAADPHPDHAMLGRVLNQLYRDGIVKRKQTYASVYFDRFTNGLVPASGVELLTNPTDAVKIDAALSVYERWDPKNGWYGLGAHSTSKQFQSMHENKYTRKTRW